LMYNPTIQANWYFNPFLSVSSTSKAGGRIMAEIETPRSSATIWGFLLALILMTTTTIPETLRASNLYLPLILRPPVCDPALTLTTGTEQTLFGSPGDDHICEYGFGASVTQYAEGAAGNDTIYQDCRGADTCDQTAITGYGNDDVVQYGAKVANTMYISGAGIGNKTIRQIGGPGNDSMSIDGSSGKNKTYLESGGGRIK
jgi:hypothetical protein